MDVAASTAKELLNAIFPTDDTQADTSEQRQIREDTSSPCTPNDIQFSAQEIRNIFRYLPLKKAPGPDGLDYAIIKVAYQARPSYFHKYYNQLLHYKIFPTAFKKGNVVLFLKKDKDPLVSSSFRPICLLSAMGKIYEKLIVNRLKFHLHQYQSISPRQFGFKQGSSTTHALQRIHEVIIQNKSQGYQTAFISIDLQSAFDTLWWPAIRQALREARCPRNIYQVLDNYLANGQLMISNNSSTVSITQVRGCPQGSCAGPLLWNLTFNKVLEARWPQHTVLVAYADDAALLVRGRTRAELEAHGSESCTIFANLCEELKLQISTTKCTAIIFPRKGTNPTRSPCIKLQGRNIKVVKTLRYLGVIWDPGLTWLPHIQAQKIKTSAIARRSRQFQGRNWGRNPHIQKVLYKTVAEKVALYAAAIWAQPMTARKVKQLLSLQRPFAIGLCRAYRTTATYAALTLAGIIPLHIQAELEATYTKIIHLQKDATFAGTLHSPANYEHPCTPLHTHPAHKGLGIHTILKPSRSQPEGNSNMHAFYTDGSKTAEGVGSAFIYYRQGHAAHHWKGHLNPNNSIFQAEVVAITAAIEYVALNNITHVQLYTDSMSTLLALDKHSHASPLIIRLQHILKDNRHAHVDLVWIKAHAGNMGNETADELAKEAASNQNARPISVSAPPSFLKSQLRNAAIQWWQREWDQGDTGRRAHSFLPKVTTERLMAIAPLTNFITGHGPFPDYFYRRTISTTDRCVCGGEGSPDHYIFQCPLTEQFHFPIPANISAFHKFLAKNRAAINKICKIITTIAAYGQDLCQPE